MSKNGKHTITLIIGILTALVIVFFQVFYFQAVPVSHAGKAATKTEKHDAKEATGDNSVISLPAGSMPSPTTAVELNHEAVCVLDILFEQETECDPSTTLSHAAGKLFSTLFRVIISPNAP